MLFWGRIHHESIRKVGLRVNVFVFERSLNAAMSLKGLRWWCLFVFQFCSKWLVKLK